jgi:uncharacterized protein YndB with AHSA1/START domain/DNA-binding transcriptional ArsR family regulator
MNDELIFKALADAHRRTLLDALFAEDGQTLAQLQNRLPMTRFGTMKHLDLLEQAGLITTRKVGREKFHYLNPVPIQQVYERWVSKFAQPWMHTLSGLKHILEENPMSAKPDHVFRIFIRTTPEKLWQALTDGSISPLYYFGTRVESTWEAGAPYRYAYPHNNESMIEGEVISADPPHTLVTTFRPLWNEELRSKPVTTVRFEIEPQGDVCKLTLTHLGLEEHDLGIQDGWACILSGLKTLLETGEPMPAGA